MNKNDLIKNIRIKMDVDPLIEDDYYENYYGPLINECLSVVANTVLPYQAYMEFKWGGYIDNQEDLENLEEGYYYTFGVDFPNIEAKRKDWYEFKDGEWKVQKRNTYGYLATIPNGFLSFSDEASVEFRNSYGELTLNVDILYVNSTTLALSKDGNYKIWYNSEYPDVEKIDDDEEYKWLPTNVAKTIPSYVAGQLLSSEDPIKATQLKNEFETMLARLDANKPLVPYNITNKDGWV